MPNLPCRNKDLAIALKNWIKSSIKLSMKDRIHFPNLFISLKVVCERLLDPPLISKLTKKLFITYHMTLKFSIRSSFSKKRSKDSFLGKLLMDYISSISPSTSNIIVRALNALNCSTSARSNSVVCFGGIWDTLFLYFIFACTLYIIMF